MVFSQQFHLDCKEDLLLKPEFQVKKGHFLPSYALVFDYVSRDFLKEQEKNTLVFSCPLKPSYTNSFNFIYFIIAEKLFSPFHFRLSGEKMVECLLVQFLLNASILDPQLLIV